MNGLLIYKDELQGFLRSKAMIVLAVGMPLLVVGRATPGMLTAGLEPAVLSLAGMAIACAVGAVLGVLVDSVAVSAILAVYLGNQLGAVAVLPAAIAPELPALPSAVAAGVVVPLVLLLVAGRVFYRKTL